MYLVLPLAAAIIFALGSIFTKRAFAEGARLGQAFLLNSVFLGLAFQPLWLVEAPPSDWSLGHRPVLTGCAFLAGHLLNFLALRSGHVSIVTPLLGAKVVLVAFLLWGMMGVPLGPGEWCAAVLTAGGVFLMGRTESRAGSPRSRWRGGTVLLALLCSLFFSLCDVSLQAWAGDFGLARFLPVHMGTVALVSCLALPFSTGQPIFYPRAARKWLFLAALCSTLQALLITFAIGQFRDANSVNVVYATRGIWAIVLIGLAGSRLGNLERREVGSKVLWFRLVGALCILSGVVLILLAGRGRPSP